MTITRKAVFLKANSNESVINFIFPLFLTIYGFQDERETNVACRGCIFVGLFLAIISRSVQLNHVGRTIISPGFRIVGEMPHQGVETNIVISSTIQRPDFSACYSKKPRFHERESRENASSTSSIISSKGTFRKCAY